MVEYREGAIKSIHMENWMAYSGPVVLTASPGVNIIAAANGCGKSAIVCAIALGLGFDLNVLSRGEKIKSFVKRGCNRAKLKIVLANSSARQGVTEIERTITLGTQQPTEDAPDVEEVDESANSNKRKRKKPSKLEEDDDDNPQKVANTKSGVTVRNEWHINGKSATLDMVRQLHSKLNLQISNLLTFLAQANVGKFASMSQHDLFKSTLSAIEPSLCTDLDSLINMSKVLKTKHSEMQSLTADLNSVTLKISHLRVISDTLSKMKDATLYANLVKHKLFRVKIANLEKGRKANKTRMSWRSEELKRSEEEKASLDNRMNELNTESARLLRESRSKLTNAKKINLMTVTKQGRNGSYSTNLLADDNHIDKEYYDSMTALRAFAASHKPQAHGSKVSASSRGIIEHRLSVINKQIEVLQLQVTGENELASEIAECRINEESLKASLRKLQNTSLRGYSDIQVDNLLKKLNIINRNSYRRFLKWRRETVEGGANKDGRSVDRDAEQKRHSRIPKLIISDLKVEGRLNCCMIEEAISKYVDCLLIPVGSLNNLSSVNKFNLPAVTVPKVKPILCHVTDTMKKFGVTHFLHQLVSCDDPDTKHTIANIAQLGTTFVVNADAISRWVHPAEQDESPKNGKKDLDNPSAQSDGNESQDGKENGQDGDEKSPQAGASKESKDSTEQSGTPKAGSSELPDEGNKSETESSEKDETKTPNNTDGSNNKDGKRLSNTAKRESLSVANSPKSPKKGVEANKRPSVEIDTSCEPSDESPEDSRYKVFYDTMLKEISKQIGRKVYVLRYYVGTKRHIYRQFKDDPSSYTDYAVEIPRVPTILYDCSALGEADMAKKNSVEKELSDVAERLRVLSGMLYGRKQDNRAVGGRLYSLNREKLSLERTLEAIDGPYGSQRAMKSKQEELDRLLGTHKEKMMKAIDERANLISDWIEKVSVRRTNLLEAHNLYEEYKKKMNRIGRLEELSAICNTTYEEVKSDVDRISDTLTQQDEKYKKYSDEIRNLNVLIKAISGEMARSSGDENMTTLNQDRQAREIRQEASLKLESMTEGDLERELHIAEHNVKQLERDDCEEAQNAKEIRDEMIREKKLSTEIGEVEGDINQMTAERSALYEKWIGRVNHIVTQVDNNFGRYMRDIGDGSAGQVRVEANLENINEAKLKILVKFHSDRDLLPLAASYQSGGERGVTTMVYILAVQNLTTNPFFVIDEINQGLDSNYEKRIMGLLLRHNSRGEAVEGDPSTMIQPYEKEDRRGPSPQYFVLTPQLLPNIDLRGATLHFPLNGAGVLNGVSI
ncbi:hypothetical protein BgAZ_300360 [Babesia gibsoni]|uniref:Structural maintenance of chromosomes protein 5 n=1 Tax=Babesia gibsoni TaxID=33632 RepID=A0AAD8PCT6_BABGI|nr:hypothetical protein BgAZ_300360 [Babesia gibsoni]